MDEILDTFTKDGRKIGTISKRAYYSQTEDAPWIKCCVCFVVDKNGNKILFEKRGNTLIDAGKLDLCSGHVQSGELPRITMAREINEELGIPLNIASTTTYLGDVLVDYSKLSDQTNRRNMKCITSMFALGVTDLDQIHIDNDEVVRFAWLSREDAIAFIKNSMTRIPYEKSLREPYEKIFSKLDSFMRGKKPQNKEKIMSFSK